MKVLVVINIVLIVAVYLKTMIGFHFPWEKCECCGKKYRDHARKN